MDIFKEAKDKKADTLFVVLFFLLVIIGFIALWSSSFVLAEKVTGDKYYYIKQHLIKGTIPSIILFSFFSFLNYKQVRKYSKLIYFVSVGLLILVLIIGFASGGSRSWIDLKLFSFQPSEIAKVAIIVFLAYFFEKQGKNIQNLKGGFLNFIILSGIPLILILLQPDLGTLIIFSVICFVMAFSAKARISHLAMLLAVVVIAVMVFLKVDTGTRLERIDIFLHPDKYSTQGEGYHINQALIAVGTGGWVGRGIGKSIQKYSYLPQVMTDSIFAVIAEEAGFIFTSLFLVIFFLFINKILSISKNAPDDFSKYFTAGFASWMAFQCFVNIGAMIRLSPLTGVTLPLISYGATSMWVIAIGAGITSNISRHCKETKEGRMVNKNRNNILILKE